MKFRKGQRVHLREDLMYGTIYGDIFTNTFNPDLKNALKDTIFIIEKTDSNDNTIQIQDNNNRTKWYSAELFEKANNKVINKTGEDVSKQLKEQNEEISKMLDKMNDVIKNQDKILKEAKEESTFEKAMKEAIIEKGKEIATKDLEERIKNNLDEFIRKTYGILPKEVIIKQNKIERKMQGIFHKDFDKICNIVANDIPLMLVGGAGAGKNYTLEQVAKGLGLTFYSTNAINQEYKLTGFIDANGVYHETEFYKAFKDGGMFFLDEIDASSPEALIILNSAIANRYFDFPIGRIEANKDFRVVCAGNTYGTGADMIYVGRNVLDGATLDRFVVLNFDYDEQVERQLAYDEELYLFIKDLRDAINQSNLRYIVSMRALINSTKLLEIGIDKETILKTTIIKNMQKDDINTIINKLKTSSEWVRELRKMSDM